MKDERYEAVMCQDYPKDFISDEEWDYIESFATCGKNNKTNNNGVPYAEKRRSNNMIKKYGTDQQQAAYNAGYGYVHGKANKRVPVQPENQAAFRDGVNVARSSFGKSNVKKEKKQFTVAETIDYYSDRVADQSLTKGQRSWAAKRLQQLVKSK